MYWGARRSAEFDPKKDSIIRVQFHRLREKLGEYYANGGAHHPVQILIPRGHYAPQFVYNENGIQNGSHDVTAAEALETLPTPAEPVQTPAKPVSVRPPVLPPRRLHLRVLVLTVAGVALLAVLAFRWEEGAALQKMRTTRRSLRLPAIPSAFSRD